MINLALRTEYSFQRTFGHLKNLVKGNEGAIGIADLDNTYAHVKFQKYCDDKKVKPIFGVRLSVVKSVGEKVKTEGWKYIFIAKNNEGLKEIYALVKKAYENFYYIPRIGLLDAWQVSENVFVISDDFEIEERIDYVALTTTTNPKTLDFNLPRVCVNNNNYTNAWDKGLYESLGNDRNRDVQTYPQHVLSDREFYRLWKDEQAIKNTHIIADQCNARIQKAEFVKFRGKATLRDICLKGALEKGIDLSNPVYSERLDRELKLIEEKKFSDYFLIVAEMVKKAKLEMMVGPSRGSSAGSLVCFLTSITEVDPIRFDLIFERFVDLNRSDIPDIDIDFPDKKRQKVIDDLIAANGRENVRHIGTISKLKAKSAIGQFAMSIGVPAYDTKEVKDAIIERSGGDARSAMCIKDTLETTEVGKALIEKYPNMKFVEHLEDHARHSGVHAAGIIVCNEPLYNYGGVNVKDDVIMMDKKDAEYLNLLKIDCLGLRTLSVLEDCARHAGFHFEKFYSLPLDDQKVFDIFNQGRFHGIFQFEGYSLQSITKGMGVKRFDDIVAITSLARPGALHSGGTTRYVKMSNGEEQAVYYGDMHKKIVGETFGIVIYQEQMMNIARHIGNLAWMDVDKLRRAAAKSLGDEFFAQFKEKFMEGATTVNKIPQEHAEIMWNDICHCGSWIFNKSHAVSYGLISYWTAWCKTYHPKEFTVANLNNARDEESAVRILRDAVKYDGIEYIPIDPDESDIEWTVNKDGKLVGGLTSIKGIGVSKAREIIKRRKQGVPQTDGILKKLLNPETPFNILFPADYHWGDLYRKYSDFGLRLPPQKIESITAVAGDYMFIGLLSDKNLRDLNEYQSIVKRGGKKIESDTLFLNLTFEDDTDSIMATIDRWQFERIGRPIAEKGIIGEHWYLVKGRIKNDGWRRVVINEILNLNEYIGLKEVHNVSNR